MKGKKKTTSKKSNANKKASNKQTMNQMKYEIASEFGISLGADSSSKANGTVGGEITKRLVKMGESKLGSSSKSSKN